MITNSVIFSCLILGIWGQMYEDKRCRCVCPGLAEVLNNTVSSSTDRKLFIADVPPNKCNCVEVILPRLGDEIQGHEQEYCPRCECKYETRNTTVIKVVVITVIWLTTLLIVYSCFLTCLMPFLNRRRPPSYTYKDHGSEEARHLIRINEEEED